MIEGGSSPLREVNLERISQAQNERIRAYRNAKICDLEANCNAAGIFGIIFAFVWLAVGYSIPYYQENGGIVFFWVSSLLMAASGFIFHRWYNS